MARNHLKEEGYTVAELAEHLKEAVEEGMGLRRVLVGPNDNESSINIAMPVVGIEANDIGAEGGIYWLYPGLDEWSL